MSTTSSRADIRALAGLDASENNPDNSPLDFRKTVRAVAGPWTPPGFGMKPDQAVVGMQKIIDLKFGIGKDIDSATALSRFFHCYQGEKEIIPGQFEPDNVTPKKRGIGGAGTTLINGETQDYTDTFWDTDVYSFTAQGLKISGFIRPGSGSFNTYLTGQIDVTSSGLFVNTPASLLASGQTQTPTPIANIGVTHDQLALMEVGDVVTRANLGLCCIAAIDAVNDTITFEGLTSGTLPSGYKGNYALHFTKMQFAQLASPSVLTENALNVSQVTLTKAAPSNVRVGSNVRGVMRGPTCVFNMSSKSKAYVTEISSDRRTIKFSEPLNFFGNLSTAAASGFIFLPGVKSGQIWADVVVGTRPGVGHPVGDEVGDMPAYAVRWGVIYAPQPNRAIPGAFTKAQIDKIRADNPQHGWARWPAQWSYCWRPGDAKGYGKDIRASGGFGARLDWAENDFYEGFNRLGNGPCDLTANNHNFAYGRRVSESLTIDPYDQFRYNTEVAQQKAVLGVAANDIIYKPTAAPVRYLTRSGGRWLPAGTDGKVKSPNALVLRQGRGLVSVPLTTDASVFPRLSSLTASGTVVTGTLVVRGTTTDLYPGFEIVMVPPAAGGEANYDRPPDGFNQLQIATVATSTSGTGSAAITTVTFTYNVKTAPTATAATSAFTLRYVPTVSFQDGTEKKITSLVTRGQIYKWFGDTLEMIDDWSPSDDYYDQQGSNLAFGALNDGGPTALFFPQRDSDVTEGSMIVTSFEVWRL